MAAIPHAERRAERVPMSTASFLKNWRSSRVVSRPKKWLKTPITVRSSSVGSLLSAWFGKL